MIVWTFVLVASLGVTITLAVLEPPAARRSDPARRPASVAQNPELEPAAPADRSATAADVELGCGPAAAALMPANVRQIRITGGYCGRNPGRAIVSSAVTNSTNGFIATVFYPSKTGYTTDYISLADGENAIRVEHAFNDGTSERRDVIVSRRPAARR